MQNACLEGDLKHLVEILDSRIEDPDFINKPVSRETRMTALQLACVSGHACLVKALLERNPNLLCTDVKERMPLHCAVEGKNVDCVRHVVDSLIDKNWIRQSLYIVDIRGFSPLHLACANAEIMNYFCHLESFDREKTFQMKNFLRRIIQSTESYTILKMMTSDSSSIPCSVLNERNPLDGKTAFVMACELGHLDSAKLLKDIGADYLLSDSDGMSGAHWAFCMEHEQLMSWFSECIPQMLDLKDDEGNLPIDWLPNNDCIVETLIPGNPSTADRRYSWLEPPPSAH